jgi:TatD DNase family protein
MPWVDTHCHLHMARAEPAELMRRAGEAGVDWVVCPGTDLAGSRAAKNLSEQLGARVLWSAGLHPHDAARWDGEAEAIAELAASADAVGECGLDFYRNLSPRPAQLAAFRDQLALGAELGKPVIVHCRDAFVEVFDLIEETAPTNPVVLHCWTGGRKWTRRFRDLGVYFSFAGPIAFDTGETVRLAAGEAPPDRTMVETDTPYLSPPPFRTQDNEPARVVLVGEALAAVWGMEPDAAGELTSATAARVFGR